MSSNPLPRRRSARSESDACTLLVLTNNSFLDTLVINKATGVPIYATITQGRKTVLYATDSTLTLQKVAVVSWGQSSRKSTTIAIGDNTWALEDILPTQNILQLLSPKSPTRKYACGAFTSTWVQSACNIYGGGNYTVCYKPASVGSSSRQDSSGSSQSATQEDESVPLVALECYVVPGKPRYHIRVLERSLLRQLFERDGLTELDHVVLGALLISSDPPQRKGHELAEGWMDEAAVQSLLWSIRSRTVPGEVPPLYAAVAGAVGEGGLPPPYASQISLAERPRSQ